jgi:prophage antirepressor-like protein
VGKIEVLDFEGTPLEVVLDKSNRRWISISKVCNLLGFDRSTQTRYLKRQSWSSVRGVYIRHPNGKEYLFKCIPFECLSRWVLEARSRSPFLVGMRDFGFGPVPVFKDGTGREWVSLKKACKLLGLKPEGQIQRLKRSPWATTHIFYASSTDNKDYQQVCIPVEQIPMWLATLAKSRVKSHKTEAYFIRSCRTGLIKIGTSSNPRRRTRDLAAHYPDRLELLAVGGVEVRLHKDLTRHRVHGEWFKPHKKVLLAVCAAGGDPGKPILVAGMKGRL